MKLLLSRQQPRNISLHHGFTIVETMIAMLVSVILLGGLVEIYLQSKQGYILQQNMTGIQEHGRYSLNLITQDIRRAGFANGNAGIQAIGGTSAPVTPSATCKTTDNSWGRMIDQPVFGLDDTNVPYNAANSCIPDANYIGSDILVLRYASPIAATNTEMNLSANANRLYVRTSLFQGRLFKGQDQTSNSITAIPQRVSELFAYAYYVGNSTQQCAGAAIPALFREKLNANGRPEREEVVRGIERFQLQYGIGDNGSVTQYFDADNVTDWSKVVAVRIWILARASCPAGNHTHSASYSMGNLTTYSPTDSYYRRLFKTTVMLRNGK